MLSQASLFVFNCETILEFIQYFLTLSIVFLIITELLSFYKFPGDEIPIIRGSALSALQGTNDEIGRQAILKLMEAVDEYIPEPVRQLDKPFLMPIEDVFSIQVIRIWSNVFIELVVGLSQKAAAALVTPDIDVISTYVAHVSDSWSQS